MKTAIYILISGLFSTLSLAQKKDVYVLNGPAKFINIESISIDKIGYKFDITQDFNDFGADYEVLQNHFEPATILAKNLTIQLASNRRGVVKETNLLGVNVEALCYTENSNLNYLQLKKDDADGNIIGSLIQTLNWKNETGEYLNGEKKYIVTKTVTSNLNIKIIDKNGKILDEFILTNKIESKGNGKSNQEASEAAKYLSVLCRTAVENLAYQISTRLLPYFGQTEIKYDKLKIKNKTLSSQYSEAMKESNLKQALSVLLQVIEEQPEPEIAYNIAKLYYAQSIYTKYGEYVKKGIDLGGTFTDKLESAKQLDALASYLVQVGVQVKGERDIETWEERRLKEKEKLVETESVNQVEKQSSIEITYTKLPKEFLGDYSWTEDLEMCGNAPFSILETDGEDREIGLSNGTEWGGYDIKVVKKEDYYILYFELRSEGESSKSQLLLKMIGKNLYVSTSGESSDFVKVFRCK
jgi:hypothetical protein